MPRSFEEKYEENLEMGSLLCNRMDDLKSEIKVQLPCSVKSINHATNQVSVQILDYDFDESGKIIPYSIISNVPIRQPMDSGLAYIRLPIQVGDVGTIEIFDTSVDDLVVSGNYSYDDLEDWHSLNNGLFTNGFLPQNKLFTFDYNSKIVIGTKTGAFTFKVNSNDELELIATNINITSGITNITSNVNIIGNVSITGNQTNTGNIECSGTITGATDVIANGKSGANHTHTGNLDTPTSSPN